MISLMAGDPFEALADVLQGGPEREGLLQIGFGLPFEHAQAEAVEVGSPGLDPIAASRPAFDETALLQSVIGFCYSIRVELEDLGQLSDRWQAVARPSASRENFDFYCLDDLLVGGNWGNRIEA